MHNKFIRDSQASVYETYQSSEGLHERAFLKGGFCQGFCDKSALVFCSNYSRFCRIGKCSRAKEFLSSFPKRVTLCFDKFPDRDFFMSPKVRKNSARCSFGLLLGFCIPLIFAGITNGNTHRMAYASTTSTSDIYSRTVQAVADSEEREAQILQVLGWKHEKKESSQSLSPHLQLAALILEEEESSQQNPPKQSVEELMTKNEKLIAQLLNEYSQLDQKANMLAR
jgi:hypothetical protein